MEIWKNIEGFENYQVSSLGNVKSLERKQINNLTKSISIYKERIIKKWITNSGYYQIRLYNNSLKKNLSIHRLVGIYFVPNPENKPFINHKDGDKLNNNDWNLEWNTAKENVKHSFDNFLQNPVCGINHGSSKLTEKEVLEIRISKLSQSKISKIYDISQSVISEIKNKKSWKHL